MDPDGNLWTHSMLAVQAASTTSFAVGIGLFVLFLLLCAFFSLCETAMAEYSESKLEKQAEEGERRAALFLRLAERYSSVVTKIRAGFVLSVMACEGLLLFVLASRLAAAMGRLAPGLATALALLVTIVVGTVLVLIAGYLIPRHLAWRDPNRTACNVAGLLQFLARLVSPLSGLCSLVSNGILRLMGIAP